MRYENGKENNMKSCLTELYCLENGQIAEFLSGLQTGDVTNLLNDVTYCIKAAAKLQPLFDELKKEKNKSEKPIVKLWRLINATARTEAEAKNDNLAAEIDGIITEARESSLKELFDVEVEEIISGHHISRENVVVRSIAIKRVKAKLCGDISKSCVAEANIRKKELEKTM